jgi:hypothetical protein
MGEGTGVRVLGGSIFILIIGKNAKVKPFFLFDGFNKNAGMPRPKRRREMNV